MVVITILGTRRTIPAIADNRDPVEPPIRQRHRFRPLALPQEAHVDAGLTRRWGMAANSQLGMVVPPVLLDSAPQVLVHRFPA